MSFKIKDKVEVISEYVALKGVVGEVAEINRGKCLVYFKQLKDNESITNLEALHNADKYKESKYFWVENLYLKIVEEEKMDQVKIVRKLEELDGLDNGMGAKIYLTIQGELRVSVGGIKWFDPNVGGVGTDEVLKMLGFKFEYKPLRTEKEVLADITRLACERSQDCRTMILQDVNTNKYFATDDYRTLENDKKYFNEDIAHDFAKELNEILESEKNDK